MPKSSVILVLLCASCAAPAVERPRGPEPLGPADRSAAAEESEYELETRRFFYLGPNAYRDWRDFHRVRMWQLFADDRLGEGAREAVREIF